MLSKMADWRPNLLLNLAKSLNLNNSHKISSNPAKSHHISQNLPKSHHMSSNLTESHQMYQISLNLTKSHRTSLNHNESHHMSLILTKISAYLTKTKCQGRTSCRTLLWGRGDMVFFLRKMLYFYVMLHPLYI